MPQSASRTRSSRFERALACFMCVVLVMGLAPLTAFGDLTAAFTTMGNNGPKYSGVDDDEASIWFIISDGYGNQVFDTYEPSVASAYPGLSYDVNTNTLTMNNVNADRTLEIDKMGEGFKINVVGTNRIGSIRVDAYDWGGSLTITGSGSLTVNENKTHEDAIFIEGGYWDDNDEAVVTSEKAKLHVDASVNLKLYAGEEENNAAVWVMNTGISSAKAAIDFAGTLTSPLDTGTNGTTTWEPTQGEIDYFYDAAQAKTYDVSYKGTGANPSTASNYIAVADNSGSDAESTTYTLYDVLEVEGQSVPGIAQFDTGVTASALDPNYGWEKLDTPETRTYVSFSECEPSAAITNARVPICVKEGVNPYSDDAEYFYWAFDGGVADESPYSMYKLVDPEFEGGFAGPEDEEPYESFWASAHAEFAVKVADVKQVPPTDEDGTPANGGMNPEGYTILTHADYGSPFTHYTNNDVVEQKAPKAPSAPSSAPQQPSNPAAGGSSSPAPSATVAGIGVGRTATVGGATYKATSANTVSLTAAKNAKSFTVPSAVTISGKSYTVAGIAPKAFANAKKCKVVKVKAKSLTKKSIKNCLKGSKVTKVKLSGISGKTKKNYKKWFSAKKVTGKKVTVK